MSVGKLFNDTKGQERSDLLPMWGSGITQGAAVVGEYVGHGEYTIRGVAADAATGKPAQPERQVKYVKLRNVVEFRPDAPESETGTSVQHIALGVPINADTRTKLDPDTLTPGMLLLIQYTKQDAEFNNMRRFRVELITTVAYKALLSASSAEPGA